MFPDHSTAPSRSHRAYEYLLLIELALTILALVVWIAATLGVI